MQLPSAKPATRLTYFSPPPYPIPLPKSRCSSIQRLPLSYSHAHQFRAKLLMWIDLCKVPCPAAIPLYWEGALRAHITVPDSANHLALDTSRPSPAELLFIDGFIIYPLLFFFIISKIRFFLPSRKFLNIGD